MKKPEYEIKLLSKYASGQSGRIKEVHITDILEIKLNEVYLAKLYTLIQVSGIVIQMGEISKRPLILSYRCPACNEVFEVEQTEQWRMSPEQCINCENRKNFSKVYEETIFANYQWVEIQELTDNTPSGETPKTVKILLKEYLTNSCTPGETITLTGITKIIERTPNVMNLEMEYYIDAMSITNNTEVMNISLTEADISHLKEMANDPNHLQNTIQSYAPTVYGEEVVKEALIYQQCEGVERQLSAQKRRRGQFHILLAGPPGVAKSDLGEYQSLYHTKGWNATGRGASSVGLTASVVKEDDRWVLRAGVMALADRGLLFVDEIEKMRPDDSGAMHPGMEAQEIHISKAGINATVKTRCSIIAACNPVGGIWNDHKYLNENLIEKGRGLTIPLLNRFALIFVVREKQNVEDESEVVDHILVINEENDKISRPYDENILKKLFAYARSLRPKLTRDASKKIREFYLTLFKASKEGNKTILSRRQIEDLIRIAEASAKLHLRETVTVTDAENAIRVMAESLRQSSTDPYTGEINQTGAFYNEPKTMREKIKEIPVIITRLCERNIDKKKVSRIEFVDYASRLWRCSQGEVGDVLNVLLKDGTVYCPTPFTLSVSTPQSLNTLLDTEEGEGEEA